ALPGGLDVDLRRGGSGALALDRCLRLALLFAQPRRLGARRALARVTGLAARLAPARGAVGVGRLGLRMHGAAVVLARGLGLALARRGLPRSRRGRRLRPRAAEPLARHAVGEGLDEGAQRVQEALLVLADRARQ